MIDIVFLNLLPIDGVNHPHAMVVTAVDDDSVNVYDRLQGERLLPRSITKDALLNLIDCDRISDVNAANNIQAVDRRSNLLS